MKLEAGTDRVSSTKIVVCEVLHIVYSDLRISRYFTVFHEIPPYLETETGPYHKLDQTIISTLLPNK